MCVLCVSQVHKVHVCVFWASLFLLCVCFVCVSLCLCIFGLFSFIMCVCLCHRYTGFLFMYFWPLLFALYMCFVCVTSTQGPHLCIFGLFSFIICLCFVCDTGTQGPCWCIFGLFSYMCVFSLLYLMTCVVRVLQAHGISTETYSRSHQFFSQWRRQW